MSARKTPPTPRVEGWTGPKDMMRLLRPYECCRTLSVVLALLVSAASAQAQQEPSYVGSDVCASCHAKAAEAWAGSHHARAWTLPSAETVKADFDGTRFELDGMTARFRIAEDGSYRIEVTERDGATADYRVHSVAGIEPLQQYLIETEPGRLQSFDVVWDTERGGWFHLYPGQQLSPDDGLHWTGPYKTWNARCASCHATGFEKNYDHATRTYASTQAERGVGCEACHGPAQAHLDWVRGDAISPALAPFGFTMDFSAGGEATIQQCAGCHSRREALDDGNPRPGTPFHDAYELSLLRPGLYEADGQILDEVFVYGSFLQSKMYEAGVGCSHCHDPHSAELVATGNAVCTQCHNPAGRAEFPTLKPAAYDSPEHTFHEPGTPASECKSCHMAERAYMGNDWRADHSFRIPRPDLAAAIGAPDACTTCHSDRDGDWAVAEIAARFPHSRNREPHFGWTLARGREDPVAAAGDLAALASDERQPDIVRATALRLLESANSPAAAERLAPLLSDPDPLVRAAAVRLQRTAPPQERVLRAMGLLEDPVRTVRIAAARTLLGAPVARLPEATDRALRAAFGEWQAALSTRLDFPETHLVLGGTALAMRNIPAAERAFAEVTLLDPQMVDAWVMRVRIAMASSNLAAARAILREALAANGSDPLLQALRRDLGVD